MALRWHADDGPTLNACCVALIFQAIRATIAEKSYILVIFQKGGPNPLPLPLDPPVKLTLAVPEIVLELCSYSGSLLIDGSERKHTTT